ncbi:hypothetical protein ACWPMX_07760 [Tsuneonella sp. HG094]
MSLFGDFGMMMVGEVAATPLANSIVAVQDFQTGTTTGNVDYTTATLSGLTPKAALIFATRNSVANEPGGTVGAQIGITRIGSILGSFARTFSEDGQTTTDVTRIYDTGGGTVLSYNSAGSAAASSGSATLISGGIRVNYSTATTNFRDFYIAFGGSDLTTGAGAANLGTGTSALSQSQSFKPDAVILFGICATTEFLNESFFTFSLGVALSDGTQMCSLIAEADNVADGSPLQALLTNRCGGQIGSADGSLSYSITAGNFTTSGFDLTPSASAGSDRLLYTALNFGGRRTKLQTFITPTSTGSHAVTGVGFTPQFALVVLTSLEATDPTFPISTSNLMTGHSICAIGDEQWCSAIYIESGAATTNTGSQVKNTAILLRSPSGAAVEATLTSFDSDGMTLNYSAVQANGKKGFVLFVE